MFKKARTAEYVRPASHSGSWYDARKEVLEAQLQRFIDAAREEEDTSKQTPKNLQAIIAPHAGLSFSGPTAAYAYSQVSLVNKKRVFVIGPSHHVFTKKMHISQASELETPVGNIKVDAEIRSSLMATGLFETMTAEMDEDEHSIEMHLPYVAHIMNQSTSGDGYSLIPIMIGSVSRKSANAYADELLPYFLDPSNLFIISSDFCHWGNRFRYQPYDSSKGDIHQYIEWMDKEAIALIESHNHDGFVEYLARTDNTICGREAIKLLLTLIGKSPKEYNTKCVHYAQSSAARSMSDSSVSYASALVREL